MLATPHAIIGGLLATKLHDPTIGIPVAFLSHFAFDMVPHWDWGWHPGDKISRITDPVKRKRIVIESAFDVGCGFLLCFALFHNSVPLPYLFAMILAAEGPDWITVPYWLLHWDIWPVSWVRKLQHEMQLHAALPWGILNQVAAVVLFAVAIHYVPVIGH